MRIEHTQDVKVIRPLGERWLSECNAKDFGLEVSIDDVRKDIEDWIGTFPGTIILAYDGVELVGFMPVFAVKSFLGPQTLALEKYWYASKGHYAAGPLMLVEAKRWAKLNNCSHLLMSASNLASGMHDKCCKFYERIGMKVFETSYVMEI